MEPELPMLRILPTLPILKRLPVLPILRILPALPILKILPALKILNRQNIPPILKILLCDNLPFNSIKTSLVFDYSLMRDVSTLQKSKHPLSYYDITA
jgi:hypothetical protein